MRTEAEKPHVLHPNEGLRNVDYLAVSESEFFNSLLSYKYLGHGTEAVVLEIPNSGNILRLPYFNVLGQEKTLQMLNFFLPVVKMDRSTYLDTIDLVSRIAPQQHIQHLDQAQKSLLTHVAAANARYRHHPGKTIPINVIYTLNDQPLATLEKRIEGRKAYFRSQIAEYEKEITVNGGDFAEGNIFFDVSPYVDQAGQVRYLHPYHFIDFSSFVPSNH